MTPREIKVLTLIARGYTNQKIAHALGISVSTVKKHLRGVISKLGVSDRTQAAVRAVELGVLAKTERATSQTSTRSNGDPALPRGDQKDHMGVTKRTISNVR